MKKLIATLLAFFMLIILGMTGCNGSNTELDLEQQITEIKRIYNDAYYAFVNQNAAVAAIPAPLTTVGLQDYWTKMGVCRIFCN